MGAGYYLHTSHPPELARMSAQNVADEIVREALEGVDGNATVAAEEKALDLLRQELNRLNEQVSQTEKTIAEAAFRRRSEDQTKNRE